MDWILCPEIYTPSEPCQDDYLHINWTGWLAARPLHTKGWKGAASVPPVRQLSKVSQCGDIPRHVTGRAVTLPDNQYYGAEALRAMENPRYFAK